MFTKLRNSLYAGATVLSKIVVAAAAAVSFGSGQAWALSTYDGTNSINLNAFDAPGSFAFSGNQVGGCGAVYRVVRDINGEQYRVGVQTNTGWYLPNSIQYFQGIWDTNQGGSQPITTNVIAECIPGASAADIQNLTLFNANGESINSITFHGIEFIYNGFRYTYGINDVGVVNERTAIDSTSPTVSLSSTTTTLSGVTPFTVTATFDEDVTGFTDIANDVTITNGAVTGITAVSASVYTLSVTPTGAGDVSISIPAAAAQDLASNPNTASTALVIGNTIIADTQRAIASFMLGRANNLIANQPGLMRFLQNDGCSSFAASATNGSGAVSGCVSQGNTWAEITGSRSGDDSYTLGSFGAHSLMNPNLLVGAMLQVDYADDAVNNTSGSGWMVGPYFVARIPEQPFFIEGRLLYGQTDNDISPLGTFTDSFDTERFLAQLRTTGEYNVQAFTLMPLLDVTYTDDTQKTYVDGLGNTIPGQTVSLTQVTAGMNFATDLEVASGSLELVGGLSGIYSASAGAAASPKFEHWRGRTHLGLNYGMATGGKLRVSTFYDGIGTNYESYGASLGFDMEF